MRSSTIDQKILIITDPTCGKQLDELMNKINSLTREIHLSQVSLYLVLPHFWPGCPLFLECDRCTCSRHNLNGFYYYNFLKIPACS
jgi:hypothetical protein